jgi:chemotaxis methyl-accepting protein methylase/signal transduction histidine kinase
MASQNSNLTIVGVGVAPDGLKSLKELFGAMPADTGLAFVVIPHLNADRSDYPNRIPAKIAGMAVVQAEEGTFLAPNSVYTMPPHGLLSVKEGRLHLTETKMERGRPMPIDFFFRSLAEDRRAKAIAVLLSGSGADGMLGIREIHGAGGVVLVEDPGTDRLGFMLQSAIATGIVDSVLATARIPAVLLECSRQSGANGGGSIPAETEADALDSILGMPARRTKHNLGAYRKATVWDRIRRRMGVNRISSLPDYRRLLQKNPEELARLARDLLTGAASFFRDPDALEKLRAKVIAPLVEQKHDKAPLRVWTVGCSTGEESYSVAALIHEQMSRNQASFPVQIFATDVMPEHLKCAREAIYPDSIAADVSPERLARFFVERDGGYQVSRKVRDEITFTAHSVLVDPPFLNMDLITCRNLLSDIEAEMQQRALALFAFALKPGSYLFLGKSDGFALKEAFEPISRRFGIYRRSQSRAPAAAQGSRSVGGNSRRQLARILNDHGNSHILHVEAKNESLKRELDSTGENFRASFEEFTSVNDELVAANAELKTINEELETAKEELQSVNDELLGAKSQLSTKLQELAYTNDDLANFLNSSEVGTIFQNANELEQQLIASGRLVSLGEITASMAHEFNNPLAIIMGFSEALLAEIGPSHPHHQALRIIDEETKRCQKIIREMMEFARPQATTRCLIDMAGVIDTTLHLIKSRLYKQKVAFAKDIQANLPRILADPEQVEQVLINLYLNALDSMPSGGTLTVATTTRSAGSEPMMAITVADTGIGIDNNDLKKIFQPFFTAGKRTGLGLGLSVCDRIVKNHGGRIEVQSRKGKGTTFQVYLPLNNH